MAGMTVEEASGIINELIGRTQEGAVKWSRGGSDYIYQYNGSKLTYLIISDDEDDRAPYRFEVWLRKETPTKLADAITRPNWALNVHLERLYAAAKLSSVGITSLLDEVLEDLKDPF